MPYGEVIHVTQKKIDEMVGNGNLDFRGCKLFDLKITGDLKGANFEGARISECQIKAADFKNANFKNAVIGGGDLSTCRFENVDFPTAHIYALTIKDSIFDLCNFEKAKFTNIVFEKDVIMKTCNFKSVFADRAFFHMPPENHRANIRTNRKNTGAQQEYLWEKAVRSPDKRSVTVQSAEVSCTRTERLIPVLTGSVLLHCGKPETDILKRSGLT